MSSKHEIRNRIWEFMEKRNIAAFPRPVYGRIPNFRGAEEAARRAATLPEFKKAVVVKANPDSPQRWLRLEALRQGKKLLMATPRLREGFLLLDPSRIPQRLIPEASTIKGAFRMGRKLTSIEELRGLTMHVDLIITGSVAVSPATGARLGKGEGYAELEYGILRELKLVDDDIPIITTVHEIQLIDKIPVEKHDVPVDIIVTPKRIIRVKSRVKRPAGILWEELPAKKICEIPMLRELRERKGFVERR